MEPFRNFLLKNGKTGLMGNPKSEAEICDWCVVYLAKLLDRPEAEIDPAKSFAQLGLDSAMATYFIVDLEQWVGVELIPEMAFEYPSIAKLSAHIAGLRP
jgi:acyl carrier protein